MTFEGAKELLQDLKNAKQRALNIQARIVALAGMKGSLQSVDYTKPCVQGGRQFSMQSILERLECEIEKLNSALEIAFALEDEIADAINQLSPTEQDIIIGCYMDCKFHWQLAGETGYSEPHLKRLKRKAIEKLAMQLKDDTP